MATKYWIGDEPAAAQISTGSIDSVDGTPANNTFTVTVGDQAISQAGSVDVATTAAALVALLNASTHIYFSVVTWTNPSAGNITGTADTAGVPFVAVLTETGAGTGAITDFAATTVSSGPGDWSTAGNWSDGSIPANSDTIIFANSTVSCVYGLAQSGVDLTALEIRQSYTGKIGLRRDAFAISADGATVNSASSEYRQDYLDIGSATIEIGEHAGAGAPAGSSRIKIDNDSSSASTLIVHRTANQASESTLPAVRYKVAHASSEVIVRTAIGGVGIAVDAPGEVSTVGTVRITDDSTSARVTTGDGVTITTWVQEGGVNVLRAAATVTTATVNNGELDIEGPRLITTLNANGGTVRANNVPAAGASITTANITDATLDMSVSGEAQTVTTLNLTDSTLRATSLVTLTTLVMDGTNTVRMR